MRMFSNITRNMNIFDTEREQQDEYLGTGGDLTITTSSHKEPILDNFFKAVTELGYDFRNIYGAFQDSGLSTNGLRFCTLFYLLEQLRCHTG